VAHATSSEDTRPGCKFRRELRGWLAAATLPAIAGLIVVHGAILARLRATRLVCRETHRANRGGQNRKQNFQIILHKQPSSVTTAKASGKDEKVEMSYGTTRSLTALLMHLS
jgi:hypothetical protein